MPYALIIAAQEVSLKWADWNFCPNSANDLLQARKKIAGHHVLRLHSDNAPDGNFDLLQWVNTWVFVNKQNGVLAKIYKEHTGVDLVDLPPL